MIIIEENKNQMMPIHRLIEGHQRGGKEVAASYGKERRPT